MMNINGRQWGPFTFAARFPLLVLLVAVLLSVVSIYYTMGNLQFLTGRDDLMPKDNAFHGNFRDYRKEFGDRQEIVVVIESKDADKATRFGSELVNRLRKRPQVFQEIFFPAGLPFFQKNGLLFLPVAELQALRENISKAKPVLKDLAAAPSVQTLFTSLTAGMEDYMDKEPGAEGMVEQRAGLVFMLDKLGAGLVRSATPSSAGFSLDEFFFNGGANGGASQVATSLRMQIVTIEPVRDANSFVPAERAIAVVREELRRMAPQPEFSGVTVGLTGVPVLEYEEMAVSKRDITIASIVSIVLTVILLLIAFRGLFNMLAAMVALLVAMALSFGMATLVVGHLNILSMVFAVMLVGIGIEYGIQVVLRYQEEQGRGRQRLDALGTALTRNFWSIVMAAMTSAAAFLTFVFTDFKGIAELGIIAAIGIACCVLVTFTVLPAMLVLPVRHDKRNRKVTMGLESSAAGGAVATLSPVGRMVKTVFFGYPRIVLIVSALLCLASLYPLSRIAFDFNLMNLQAQGLESVAYAYKLMANKENAGYFAVAVAPSAAEAARRAKALQALPTVDHVLTVASFVPGDQELKLAELSALATDLAEIRPVPYEEDLQVMALPVVFENFRATVERFAQRLEREKLPEAQNVVAFRKVLDRFFAKLEKEKDRNALGMLRDFQGNLLAGFPEKLEALKASLPVAPVAVADIPTELRSRFIGNTGRYLLQIAPKQDIYDRKPLEAFLNDVRRLEPNATGEPVMVHESMSIMRDSYRGAFLYAFLAIVVLLFFSFRSIRYTVIGLVPLVMGVLLMVSGMWLLGISFNSANVIVMPLVLGIAVDSGIYFINRYRREGESGYEVVTSSTGRGVIYNTLTIMISFGALMLAHHQGVFSIGAVMSLGMVSCQFAFLVTLPAVLVLFGEKRPEQGHP
jgi:uncharacterized protein